MSFFFIVSIVRRHIPAYYTHYTNALRSAVLSGQTETYVPELE